MNKTVDIVVLNWNGKRFVKGFIETYLKQSYPKDLLKLYFVDNGSTDDSVDHFIHLAKKSKVRYEVVLNGENYGYAQGNNLGIMQTTGDYVLVCNNDLELHKDLVKNLLETAQKNKSSVTVPKLMYLNKPGYINNAGSNISYKSAWPITEIGANEKDSEKFSKEYEITAFCGACVLFERNFLETVGLFDRKFFMYFEDGDLSWRGQKAGHKYYFSPKAIALHYHTGSSKEGSPLFNHYVGRNRLLILQKNGSYSQIGKAWVATLKDHVLLRLQNIYKSAFRSYPRRKALIELKLSLKMVLAALILLPYATAKRYRIIKEELL
jgi:GT2 family glycosyltransferase